MLIGTVSCKCLVAQEKADLREKGHEPVHDTHPGLFQPFLHDNAVGLTQKMGKGDENPVLTAQVK